MEETMTITRLRDHTARTDFIDMRLVAGQLPRVGLAIASPSVLVSTTRSAIMRAIDVAVGVAVASGTVAASN